MTASVEAAKSGDDLASPVIALLAAGASRRFGSPKQLAMINGESMLRRAARRALATGAPLIIIIGAHAEQITPTLVGLPARIVHHPGWDQGMGSSLAAGISAIQKFRPQASGALLWVADQPLVTSTMLATLLQHHREDFSRIWATDHEGQPGSPVLFPRAYFDTLAQWHGQGGAQALLQREGEKVQLCAMAASIDVDTQQDLLQVQQLLSNSGHSD